MNWQKEWDKARAMQARLRESKKRHKEFKRILKEWAL